MSIVADRRFGWAAIASMLIAAAGAIYYAMFAFNLPPFRAPEAFGKDIYDYYYLALLDGHFDLPARILRYEGHYTPDGTGYLYHGLAPLLTRFAFGWALPLPGTSLAPFSIWLWTVLGTACYHLAFLTIARPLWSGERLRGAFWASVLGVAIWFAGPGVIVVARVSLYHEPIAVAYAMAGLFVLLWTRSAAADRPWRWLPAALALCAAISLHARPNVAVGLYLGTAIAIGLALLYQRRGAWRPAVLAAAILGLSVAGYFGSNVARFGSATQAHGDFNASAVQYGAAFWGYETVDSKRSAAFVEHGKFNLGRIPPNLMLYLADVPQEGPLGRIARSVDDLFRAATTEKFGLIRIEGPRVGMLLLWPAWFVLAAAALFAWRAAPRFLGLVLAVGAAAGVTLAYGTITLRYRVDLWPVLAVFAIIGLYAVVPRLAGKRSQALLATVLVLGVLAGAAVSGLAGKRYGAITSVDLPFFARWSFEECAEKVVRRGLPSSRISAICSLPTAG